MEIKMMEPGSDETWTLSQKFAVLAYGRGPGDRLGWWLSWLNRDEDRRDEFMGGSVDERDQAFELARTYLAANGLN
ncbi:hypothetical protein ACFY2T_20295 [Streptomyces sp. NPDC001260]|uniref:hypothetical protein n=1 Tax=Streptomyces sp. NPDC001260 TaxID=3364551 RepID=UPI0036946FF1